MLQLCMVSYVRTSIFIGSLHASVAGRFVCAVSCFSGAAVAAISSSVMASWLLSTACDIVIVELCAS